MATLNPIEGSSQVAAAGYDQDTQTLSVQFWQRAKGKEPVPAPHRYDYLAVEPDVAKGFLEADSKGTYLGQVIKPAYEFEKIALDSGDEAQPQGDTA